MSKTAARVKEQIDAMTEDERFFAMAYLQQLAKERDELRKARIEQRMRRMDEGRKITGEQLLDLHRHLESQSL